MSDPLSAAASVAGLLSLGIQVLQGLVDYYSSYKSQDDQIMATTNRLSALVKILDSLQQALEVRRFTPDEQLVLTGVEDSIQSCRDLVLELQAELRRLDKAPGKGLRSIVKNAGRRVAYPFRHSTLLRLEGFVGDIEDNIKFALDVLQLKGAIRTHNTVEHIKTLLTLMRTDQITRSIGDWFKAPDASIEYEQARSKCHEGTGQWLITSPYFQNWLSTKGSFLWLYGLPGCGKSILSSTVAVHAFQERQSNVQIGIGVFHFTFEDATKQTAFGMLKALIVQLSNQLHDEQPILHGLHNRFSHTRAPIPDLLTALVALIDRFEDVFLIIDALDESPVDVERGGVLQTLSDLRKYSLKGCHIFVTSRDVADVRDRISAYGDCVNMRTDVVDKDIAVYISDVVQTDPSFRRWSAHHERIKQALTQGAKGNFRWVDCQLVSLTRCPVSKAFLEKQLGSLPASLDKTYERMLMSIPPDLVDDVKRLLSLLCFSARPLTAQEVSDALAVQTEPQPKLDLDYRLEDENDLFRMCPGFIELRTAPRPRRQYGKLISSKADWRLSATVSMVSIAHFSVQEYLESDRIRQQSSAIFSMHSATANAQLAQVCLVYLLDPAFSVQSLTREHINQYPLAEYAAEFWAIHLRRGKPDLHIGELVTRLLDGGSLNYASWLAIRNPEVLHGSPRERDRPDPLFFACLLDLRHAILEPEPYHQDQEDSNISATNTASFRLNSSAELHARRQIPPVSARVERNDIVQYLLNKGSDVGGKGGAHTTILGAACRMGRTDLINMLVDKGADVNGRGQCAYPTALQAASAYGQKEAVALLLDLGADINCSHNNPDNDPSNPLEPATMRREIAVMQLLLERGIDDTRYPDHTALDQALWMDWSEGVHMILARGPDPKTAGTYYKNASSYKKTERGTERTEIEKLLHHKGV